MELRVANDIGNSDIKMLVNKEMVKQPSLVKFLLTKRDSVESDTAKNVANLLDELIVNIASKSVKRNGMYAVGKKASASGKSPDNMNIRVGEKHTHDIPVITTLALLAARAVQLDYNENKTLATSLEVDVTMSSAIPASEYTPDKAKILEGRFRDTKHTVIVYVGDVPITVILTFSAVKVTQEGNPAIFAIAEGPSDILRLYNKQYNKQATPKEFRHKKVFHLDIGDGTTEYIYTIGPKPIADACSGERRGVGHATEEALELFLETLSLKIKFNRQQFMDVLRDQSHHFHEDAVKCMDEAKLSQVDNIVSDVEEKYAATFGNVEVFSVYGGGSIQFKDPLYNEILAYAESVRAEVLWIPEEYAVDLNVRGLDILNDKVFFPKKG